MRSRLVFYAFIAGATVLDSLLLTSPNLLGKVGLIIYKYHYLRTFPRALLTVGIVVGVAIVILELIRVWVARRALKRSTGRIILFAFVLLCVAALIKTGLDFSTWTYSHTGARFRYGAYLLPLILTAIFGFGGLVLPAALSEKIEEVNTTPNADDRS